MIVLIPDHCLSVCIYFANIKSLICRLTIKILHVHIIYTNMALNFNFLNLKLLNIGSISKGKEVITRSLL